MARTFEIINFLILALAIGIPLVRFIPKVIRKRSQTLTQNIESARKGYGRCQRPALNAVEAKLSNLDAEIGQVPLRG